MLRASVILPILILATLVSAIYLANIKLSKYPSEETQKTAGTIPKYPKAISWHISSDKKFCVYYITGCRETPTEIVFTTQDTWTNVYWFYRQNLQNVGWVSNSNIVTSIPSSIVLNNTTLFKDVNCEAIVSEKNFKYSNNQDKENKFYEISVTCFKNRG